MPSHSIPRPSLKDLPAATLEQLSGNVGQPLIQSESDLQQMMQQQARVAGANRLARNAQQFAARGSQTGPISLEATTPEEQLAASPDQQLKLSGALRQEQAQAANIRMQLWEYSQLQNSPQYRESKIRDMAQDAATYDATLRGGLPTQQDIANKLKQMAPGLDAQGHIPLDQNGNVALDSNGNPLDGAPKNVVLSQMIAEGQPRVQAAINGMKTRAESQQALGQASKAYTEGGAGAYAKAWENWAAADKVADETGSAHPPQPNRADYGLPGQTVPARATPVRGNTPNSSQTPPAAGELPTGETFETLMEGAGPISAAHAGISVLGNDINASTQLRHNLEMRNENSRALLNSMLEKPNEPGKGEEEKKAYAELLPDPSFNEYTPEFTQTRRGRINQAVAQAQQNIQNMGWIPAQGTPQDTGKYAIPGYTRTKGAPTPEIYQTANRMAAAIKNIKKAEPEAFQSRPPTGPRPKGATHWSPTVGYIDRQGNPVK